MLKLLMNPLLPTMSSHKKEQDKIKVQNNSMILFLHRHVISVQKKYRHVIMINLSLSSDIRICESV